MRGGTCGLTKDCGDEVKLFCQQNNSIQLKLNSDQKLSGEEQEEGTIEQVMWKRSGICGRTSKSPMI